MIGPCENYITPITICYPNKLLKKRYCEKSCLVLLERLKKQELQSNKRRERAFKALKEGEREYRD